MGEENKAFCGGMSFSPTHPGPNLTPGAKDFSILLTAIVQEKGPMFAANRAILLA
jgi:hypothetical protein